MRGATQISLQPAFRALADPTRRQILKTLGQREMSLREVTAEFSMTRAAVRKHLDILEEGGLIHMRRQGRETLSALNANGLKPVFDWLGTFDQFWDDKLEQLKTAIETENDDD